MSTLKEDYTLEQFKDLFSQTDEATIEDLYSFYGYRTPISDPIPFSLAITQTELIYTSRYKKLLRDESVTYDAMVTDYMERLVTDERTGKSAKTGTGGVTEETTTGSTETGTNQNTTTNNLKQESNGTADNTQTDDTTQTVNATTSASTTETRNLAGSSESQGLNKTNPMQVTYPTTAAGAIPSLDWTSADGQQQQKQDTTNTGTVTTEGSTEDSNTTKNTGTIKNNGTTSDTTTNTGTVTDNGNTSRTLNGTGTRKTTNDTTDTEDTSESGTTKERYTGRHGYNPAELLDKSRSYILGTNAFQWLCEKYNNCFTWNIEI